MKSISARILEFTRQQNGETLATFGDARLVKKLDGKIELLGGSPDDRSTAKEWCSLFMHEAIISSAGRPCLSPPRKCAGAL